MRLQRIGRLVRDPARRIAMVGDGHGFKLELVEGADPDGSDRLLHVAWHVDDVDESHDRLIEAGCTSEREPFRLDAARGRTAIVQPPAGVPVQLVHYDADSPDR
jgi:hypothetical protein